MTLELTTIKAVKHNGVVWIINKEKLYMTDEEGTYYQPFPVGSETYLSIFKKVSSLPGLKESERVEIVNKILKNVKEELLAEVQPMI